MIEGYYPLTKEMRDEGVRDRPPCIGKKSLHNNPQLCTTCCMWKLCIRMNMGIEEVEYE